MNARNRFPRPATAARLLAILLTIAAVPAAAQDAAPPEVEGRGEFEMVLIHGLGSRASVWDQVLPYLKGTFTVRTFELSGHGSTQPILNPSIDAEVQRLEQFIADQGLVYPTLVGHGIGAVIALKYSLDHPRDVHRLIMMDAAPRQLAGPEEKAAVAKALAEDYDRFVASRYLNMSHDRLVSQEVMDSALRTDSATFISLLMSSFEFDLTDRLDRLSVPLLVVGSEMMFPNPDASRQILASSGFDHARSLSYKRIQGGHFMMLERPVTTASVLLTYGVTPEYEFQN